LRDGRRRLRCRRAVALLAGLLVGAAGNAGGAGGQPPSTAVERRATFARPEVLALAGGELLVWNSRGRAQLRRADGTWTVETGLPLASVRLVERDGGGFLAVGSAGTGNGQAVVQFDADARELRRWTIADVPVFGVTSDRHGRRLAAPTGFIALHDDGTLGTPAPYPQGAPKRVTRAPMVVVRDAATVMCWSADRSLLGHADAECRRLGERGWRVQGDFVEAPVACGEWLVVRAGAAQASLDVYALSTGTRRGRASYGSIAPIACVGTDMLLVGERRLTLARLPMLDPAWTSDIERDASIRSVAVLPDRYALASGDTIVLVERAQ
jgi:hypothetical protein